LYPVTPELLSFHERLTECRTAAVPLPLRASVVAVLDALLANETLADAAPLSCGVKVRVNDAEVPAGIVIGSDGPVIENSDVLTEADVIVTLEPLALTVAGRFLLEPTATLPKLKLPGLMEN
jgi:hypothetical protein